MAHDASVEILTAALAATLPGRVGGPAQRRPKNVTLSQDLLEEMEREPALDYVEPSELEQAVDGGATVVDVRSLEERADGAIARSVHVPYTEARDEWKDSARRLLSGRHDLIFYCMDSCERAPRAAYEWSRIASPKTSVKVLKGGFEKTVAYAAGATPGARVAKDGNLVLENLNLMKWVRIGTGLVWAPGQDLGFESRFASSSCEQIQAWYGEEKGKGQAGITRPPLAEGMLP